MDNWRRVTPKQRKTTPLETECFEAAPERFFPLVVLSTEQIGRTEHFGSK
jgi:hypothetical protein